MWFVLALFTLVASVDAYSNTTQCPAGCSCQETSSSLTVDCTQRLPVVDVEQLSNELDAILSSEHMVNRLTSLRITKTPLTHVPTSICKLVNLTSLNLNDNKLTKLPDNCFTNLTKLVTLSINRNAITGLQDGIFDGLQSLVSLDLSFNHISSIGRRVFSNSSDLIRLRSLILCCNRLTSLEPWWYYRCILGSETSPVMISLSDNLISTFTNELQFQFQCGMKLPYGYLDLYNNRIKHIMEILKGWNLGGDHLIATILCLRNIMGSPYPLMKVNLGGDSYACDCIDFPIYKFLNSFPRSSLLHGVRCNNTNFVTYTGQPRYISSIPMKEFVCESMDRCPPGCRCVYRPAKATLHIYCSAANLSSCLLYTSDAATKRIV